MSTPIGNGTILRIRAYAYNPAETQVGINGTYWLVSGVTGVVTDLDANARFGAVYAAFYQALMPVTCNFAGVGVALMIEGSRLQQTAELFDDTFAGPGTAGPAGTPTQASYLISFKTGSPLRHFNGRIYPPFPWAGFADASGKMLAAGQVVLQQLAQQYQLGFTFEGAGTTATFTLLVRGKFPPPVVPEVSYLPVTAAIGRPRFATQRRRGQYGRINALPGS
jgi:hypothetical protein